MRQNPFAYVDYAPNFPKPEDPSSGGPPVGGPPPVPPVPGIGPDERAGFQGATTPYNTDAATQLARAQQEVTRLVQNPRMVDKVVELPDGTQYVEKNAQRDPSYASELTYAEKRVDMWTAKLLGDAAHAQKLQEDLDKYDRERADRLADRQAVNAGSGATIFAATEATRRQGLQQEWQTGESALGREFTGSENALNRAGTIENTTLTYKLKGQGEEAQRNFDAQQNALDRQIRNVQNQIAQGELDLKEGLGILQKYLEAQPYTLPQGAEYVPGFQPGGAVQEASRLAGVGYNPANYKANTVAFDPAAMVRQTMGR